VKQSPSIVRSSSEVNRILPMRTLDRKPAALITPVINRTINRIYVGNIAPTVTEAHVRALFSKFGYVKELSMTRDPELNTHKGWCFVEYDAPEAAEAAIRIMNGSNLADRYVA
jgi:RNA recognition motif-containing protein